MDDSLACSPCTMLCVLAANSCCSRTTQWRNSSSGPLVRTTRRRFRLASERAKFFALIPQFTILRNNKERALYDSIFFLSFSKGPNNMFWISDSSILFVFLIFRAEKTEDSFLSYGMDVLISLLRKTLTPNSNKKRSRGNFPKGI